MKRFCVLLAALMLAGCAGTSKVGVYNAATMLPGITISKVRTGSHDYDLTIRTSGVGVTSVQEAEVIASALMSPACKAKGEEPVIYDSEYQQLPTVSTEFGYVLVGIDCQ